MAWIATFISFCALTISFITAWLTLFRKGRLRMTRPTVIFFGPNGPTSQGSGLKVFLRILLYSTAKRAHIVEGMFVTLRRGESVQTFNIWVYGEKHHLLRGSGLRVADDGVVCDHHFVLPRDGTPFLSCQESTWWKCTPSSLVLSLRCSCRGRIFTCRRTTRRRSARVRCLL